MSDILDGEEGFKDNSKRRSDHGKYFSLRGQKKVRPAASSERQSAIKKGDIYGLIEKNGAGKTTLIKIMTQLMHASNRSCLSLVLAIQAGDTSHKQVGSVIRKRPLLTTLGRLRKSQLLLQTAPRFLILIRPSKNAQLCRPDELEKFRDFSLGMKQRLGIAIALLSKPDLMILR